MKFTIECEMEDRWVLHFLAMLKYMQHLGKVGSSRRVCLYSDGDGDFKPKFVWDKRYDEGIAEVKPLVDFDVRVEGDRLYDAG